MITVTYRYLGVDVAFDAPNIDVIQYDADAPLFSAYTTTIDVTWGGVPFHFSPAYVGPSPTVVYYTAYRVAVTNTGGAVDRDTLTLLAAAGSIQISPDDPNVAIIVSQPASGESNPFAGLSPDMLFESGYVGPVTEMALEVTATFALTGRGIVLDLPTANQWQLERASIRPREEQG